MSDDSGINAIETEYNGYKFRSRLEARWAVFFDTLDIQWVYEPEGFKIGEDTYYLPDFYLENVGLRSTELDGLWVEIKPGRSDEDNEHNEKLRKFVGEKGEPGALLVGEVANQGSNSGGVDDYHYQYGFHEGNAWWDNFMRFMMCVECESVKFEFLETNYMVCESCNVRCKHDHQKIQHAVVNARQARFEHGESPDSSIRMSTGFKRE